MLSTKRKTRVPEWTLGWVPTWEEGQWIVRFPDGRSAWSALREMRNSDHDRLFPDLAAASHPDGRGWYIGELHP